MNKENKRKKRDRNISMIQRKLCNRENRKNGELELGSKMRI